MEKRFEAPELIIIFFEGELATDDVISGSGGSPDARWDQWEDDEQFSVIYKRRLSRLILFLVQELNNSIRAFYFIDGAILGVLY